MARFDWGRLNFNMAIDESLLRPDDLDLGRWYRQFCRDLLHQDDPKTALAKDVLDSSRRQTEAERKQRQRMRVLEQEAEMSGNVPPLSGNVPPLSYECPANVPFADCDSDRDPSTDSSSSSNSSLNQNPTRERDTREEAQPDGQQYGTSGHDPHAADGHGGSNESTGTGNVHDPVAAQRDRQAERGVGQPGRPDHAPTPRPQPAQGPLGGHAATRPSGLLGPHSDGVHAGRVDTPQIQALTPAHGGPDATTTAIAPLDGAAVGQLPPERPALAIGGVTPTQSIPKAEKAARPPRPAGKTALEIEYPDAWAVWSASPAMARGRSSTMEFYEEWRKQAKNGLPPVAEVLESLECWKRSKKWSENGGEYIEGLHRWVKRRQWENPPMSSMEMAEERTREVMRRFD